MTASLRLELGSVRAVIVLGRLLICCRMDNLLGEVVVKGRMSCC